MCGTAQAAVVHYLIAKLFGPLLFGRIWCGWACWTVMVLDLLPFGRSSGRLPGHWALLRYVHFTLSLIVVLLLWFGWGYSRGIIGLTGVVWFLIGNALYCLIGIGLAYILRDNRAVCKYVCPVTVPLKLGTRFSLLRERGEGHPGTPFHPTVHDGTEPHYRRQSAGVIRRSV